MCANHECATRTVFLRLARSADLGWSRKYVGNNPLEDGIGGGIGDWPALVFDQILSGHVENRVAEVAAVGTELMELCAIAFRPTGFVGAVFTECPESGDGQLIAMVMRMSMLGTTVNKRLIGKSLRKHHVRQRGSDSEHNHQDYGQRSRPQTRCLSANQHAIQSLCHEVG